MTAAVGSKSFTCEEIAALLGTQSTRLAGYLQYMIVEGYELGEYRGQGRRAEFCNLGMTLRSLLDYCDDNPEVPRLTALRARVVLYLETHEIQIDPSADKSAGGNKPSDGEVQAPSAVVKPPAPPPKRGGGSAARRAAQTAAASRQLSPAGASEKAEALPSGSDGVTATEPAATGPVDPPRVEAVAAVPQPADKPSGAAVAPVPQPEPEVSAAATVTDADSSADELEVVAPSPGSRSRPSAVRRSVVLALMRGMLKDAQKEARDWHARCTRQAEELEALREENEAAQVRVAELIGRCEVADARVACVEAELAALRAGRPNDELAARRAGVQGARSA